MNEKDGTRPPKPAPPPDPESLPQALTFFLTVRQRRAVLAALRRHDPDRARALCRALRITT